MSTRSPSGGSAQPDPGFWAGRQVAVTGGAGFLGKPVMRMLEGLGAEARRTRKGG